MPKSAELISNVYKYRHKNSLTKKRFTYGYMNINTSRFPGDYERIELSGENFMYIKIALMVKVIAEREDNK